MLMDKLKDYPDKTKIVILDASEMIFAREVVLKVNLLHFLFLRAQLLNFLPHQDNHLKKIQERDMATILKHC